MGHRAPLLACLPGRALGDSLVVPVWAVEAAARRGGDSCSVVVNIFVGVGREPEKGSRKGRGANDGGGVR